MSRPGAMIWVCLECVKTWRNYMGKRRVYKTWGMIWVRIECVKTWRNDMERVECVKTWRNDMGKNIVCQDLEE